MRLHQCLAQCSFFWNCLTNETRSGERREVRRQTAWSSGCSSHIDSEKAVWRLLWSTTPGANARTRAHTHTAKTQECVSDVCVCRTAQRFRVVMDKALCRWVLMQPESGDDKQLFFTFSRQHSEMRKGSVLSAPLTGRMGSEPGGGGGFMDKPLRAEKSHLKWKDCTLSGDSQYGDANLCMCWGAGDGFSWLECCKLLCITLSLFWQSASMK